MKRLILAITLAATATLAQNAMAAQDRGDPQAGKEKSALCAACHGADGNSLNPVWPKLAGQHPDYLISQLQAFKSGERKDPMMAPMAVGLSDEDMRNLAAYFSSQAITPGQGKPEAREAGKRLYTGGNLESGVVACAACHGPSGMGNPQAGFPRIAGQQAAYTAKALRDFRAGTRTNDVNGMMQGVAKNLTDEEIDAVAEYITGLQ